MGLIYYIMGKSASGKDTVYRALLKERPALRPVVLYTTRPIRETETEGVEYHFVDEETLEGLSRAERVIESRTYQTEYGPWRYATVHSVGMDPALADYLMIGTLESYRSLKAFFGDSAIFPIYLELPPDIRLLRAIKREQGEARPRYDEVCRRFLADEEDFSPEKLAEAGITSRFDNTDFAGCMAQIRRAMGSVPDHGKES